MSDLKLQMLEWLDILANGDFDAWPGRVHEDVTFRFPYAPPGMAGELRGFEDARATLLSWKSDGTFGWKDIVIRLTDEPGLVMATLLAEAELADGRHYGNSYVMLTRFSGARVIEHTEYFNPVAVAAVVGAN